MGKRAPKPTSNPDPARFVPAVTLFLATIATRLIPFNVTLVGWDEWILSGISVRLARVYLPGMEWYDVLVPTGYSYPPVFFWLNGGLIYLLGSEPLVLRMITILSEAACVFTVCMVAQQLAGRFAAWAAGMLAFATLYLSFHETVTMDYLLSWWILLSLWWFLKALDTESGTALVWAIFFSSAAVFTKYHGVVYHAILCAAVAVLPATRRMLRGRTLLASLAAALALPCGLLALEALTWHFYGYEKTHIAEVLRVMGWTSYVQDPRTGAVVVASWSYYFVYLWEVLGPVVCVVGVGAVAYALGARRRDLAIVVVIAVLWFLWASTASLKNARYILPGTLMLYPVAGAMLAWVFQREGYGRQAAVAILGIAILAGLWDTRARIGGYMREADIHQRVYAYLREHVPADAVVMAESAPFQWGMSLRSGAVRPMRGPEDATAFEDSDYAVLHAWGQQLIAAGAIPSAKNYLDARAAATARWETLLELGSGREAVVILKKR